jgi:hypothetical protein
MPGFSANGQAILEIPQLPRHFWKCPISANACDICTADNILKQLSLNRLLKLTPGKL